MHTNIVINDKLIKDTLRTTNVKTKHEAVELKLHTLIQLGQQEKVQQLQNKIT